MVAYKFKRRVLPLLLATGMLCLSACAGEQTTQEACSLIDKIHDEANKQERDDAQQRKHLETSLGQITNPQVKEYTDQILSTLRNTKNQLGDLDTTTQRNNEKTRQEILSEASLTITKVKTQHIDALCSVSAK